MNDFRHTAGLLLLALIVLGAIAGVLGYWWLGKRRAQQRRTDRQGRDWGIAKEASPQDDSNLPG